MNIVNRRNAILGWTVWTISKATAKRKAKQALTTEDKGVPNKLVIGSGLAVAAAGGAFWLFRRRSGVDEI